MQEVKYFYHNQPLTTYCAEHDININTVRTRIWKKRHNPKYASLTDDEIIDMVIKAYGTAVKYMYGSITLRQYCIENDLNFSTITSRINKLKKARPELTDDEAVRLSVDEFQNHNYTLFYNGIPLLDYCHAHPEINYNTIRTYIARESARHPELTTTEIVDEYLKKEHFGIYRYYYCGIPLVTYCEEHSLSYEAILGRIRRYQKRHSTISDDEVVNIIMNEYEPFAPKYMYNNISLNSYCTENDISYYSVVSFVKRKLATNKDQSIPALIEEAIKTIKKQGIIYYYQGIPLRDYCKEHHLNASSIRSSILRKRVETNLPLQEIVNICVETYNAFTIKYFYEGIPLFQYCKTHKINYNSVISRYLAMNKQETDEERNITIKNIVADVIAHPSQRTKYFFQEYSLSQYCKKMGYSYSAVYQRIRRLREEFTYTLETEVVAEAILTYEEKNVLKVNNEKFTTLDNAETLPSLTETTQNFNISADSLKEMQDFGFDTKQAIAIIWFIGTEYPKSINDLLLANLYTSINSYTNESTDIYILYVLYKAYIVDTSNYIIAYFNVFICSIISRYQEHYRPLTTTEESSLHLELNTYILMLLDYIYLDNREKLLHHMTYLLGEKIRYFYETITISSNTKKLRKTFI